MDYVVKQPSNNTYLKGWGSSEEPTWVSDPAQADGFSTLTEAEGVATMIGGGTVGTTRPNS